MSERDIEIERLRHWKAEALPVMEGLQELGRVLGVGLGQRITGPDGVKAAKALVTERDRAVAQVAAVRAGMEDERAARKVAADSVDRFRDVVSEVLGHHDSNPGDDVLVAELRAHFGRTGPEPTRWRDFVGGAVAHLEREGFRWQSDAALDTAPASPTTDQRIEARQLTGEHVDREVVLPDGTRGTLFDHDVRVALDDPIPGVTHYKSLAPSDVVTLIGGEDQ